MENFKVEKDIESILLPSEEVLYAAQQSRVKKGGAFTTPAKIYITNYRIIFRDPSILGLKKYVNDYHFKDISNVRMKKGVLSTEVYLNSRFESDEVIISGLSHEDAEIVVRLIRNGIYGNFNQKENYDSNIDFDYSENTNDFEDVNEKKTNTEAIISNLERLNELRKSNVITLDEFNILKKRLIEKTPNKPRMNYINNEINLDEEPKRCKDCGNVLEFIEEGDYRGDYVKFYKCDYCNKTYAKKIE
ncbi:MAG: PH domain-containing protein [Candidatus Methanofastidiosum sp.]|nr:PH domain-containing protein [Methanofastidiosum sp.]